MNFTAILDALGGSPMNAIFAVVFLLAGGGWILVGSAQRRRD